MNRMNQHLNDVDETYFEHLAHASGFGWRMIAGGLACLLHGIFPFTFEKTGSNCIRTLNDRMVVNRTRADRKANAEVAVGR